MDFLNNQQKNKHKLPMLNGSNVGSIKRIRDFLNSPRRATTIGCLCLLVGNVVFMLLAIVFALLYLTNKQTNGDLPMPKWPISNSLLGEYAQAAVAADNEICSNIGRDTLLQGGNAVEAAISTIICIGVMDTYSAGIGGGHLMTIFNATTRQCHVIDAREVAPLNSTENMYSGRPESAKYGWEAVAVPGDLHGLWTEYQKFGGNVKWQALVEPTVKLMEAGYPTSHAVARNLKDKEEKILANPMMKKKFVNPETGKLFAPGEQIKTRNDLTETMKKLAEAKDPVELFYRGDMAKAMASEFEANGGRITADDLANYRSIVRPDSEVIYTHLSNGRSICGPPPPSGAAVAQGIINILDPIAFNLSTFSGTVDFLHRFIEASKFAYAIRNSLGDIAFEPEAMELAHNLSSPEWAKSVRSKMDWATHPDAYYDEPNAVPHTLPPDHGTAHVSIVDRWGNAVSVTTTLNLAFGSMVISESTGILWNDQMDDFSTPGTPNYWGFPASPQNYIRPGKKPMSSMSPLIIYNREGGKEILAIGGAGGSTIISGVAADAFHTLWQDMNIKEAIDFPRLHNQLRPNVTVGEKRMPAEYNKALEQRGHKINETNWVTVVTGVHRTKEGIVFANSDWRKGWESEPAGY